VDLAVTRSSLRRAAIAAWAITLLLSLHAPAPALAQGSQAPTGQAPTGHPPTAPSLMDPSLTGPSPGGPAPSGPAPSGQAPSGQAPSGQAPGGQEPSGQGPESAAPAPKAARSPRDGQRFQDWTLHCVTVAQGKPEACEMLQQVSDDKGRLMLMMMVGRVPNVDSPGMVILLPLYIALQPGVSLKIDDGDRRPIELKLCAKEGCQAEQAPLKPDFLSALKAGTKGTVSFYVFTRQGKQQQINVPVSLLGFSAALAEVMK
jgi:invasion protein IalB